ncbi:MAG: hypothetical protein ABJA76_05950 [Mucilaginibacter sp.]
MKLFLFSAFLIFAVSQCASAQYMVTKCDSGNCVNGRGNAVVVYKKQKIEYLFKGIFVDGKPDGEGLLISVDLRHYYAGIFKKGKRKGLGVQFGYNGKDFIAYDGFSFQDHESDDDFTELLINRDGGVESNHIGDNYRNNKFNIEIKDKALLAFADDFLTKHGKKSFSQQFAEASSAKAKAEQDYKNNVSAVKDLSLPMGGWVECYNNTFKEGRAYYPTYDYPGKGIAPAMSMFNYQIVGPDGKLLRAGEDNWGSSYKFVAPSTGIYRVLMQYKQQTAGLSNSYIMPTARVVVTIRYTDTK